MHQNEMSGFPSAFSDKIMNHAQIGGIETAVLDNGVQGGVRIAWVNTGTGLRYKIILDRAMDIADAFYNQYSLAWINYSGITKPETFTDNGTDWLRTFGGGLVTTCGLTHVGGPEKDEYGTRGLHGRISNIPAEIESVIQPDPVNGLFDMSITGRIKETSIFGPSLELKRTISGTLGKASVKIHDEVMNRGNTTAPHMMLYHCNFGWPLVDEGTEILWKGSWKPRFEGSSNKIFVEGNDFRKCPAPLDTHSGMGEEVAFIDPDTDETGMCSCGLFNSRISLALAMRFPKKQLPWLTNWQHWGKNEYVAGLEPGTNPPTGQAKARKNNQLIFLQPGEKVSYDLSLEVFFEKEDISRYLQEFK